MGGEEFGSEAAGWCRADINGRQLVFVCCVNKLHGASEACFILILPTFVSSALKHDNILTLWVPERKEKSLENGVWWGSLSTERDLVGLLGFHVPPSRHPPLRRARQYIQGRSHHRRTGIDS